MTLSRPSHVSKGSMPHPQDVSATASPCGMHNRNAFQIESVHQRCKRRLNVGHLSYMVPAAPQHHHSTVQNTGNGMPTAVAKRNERERKRVRMVNNGFTTLRQHVPSGAKNKKLSKVETLRSAIDYIKHLQQVLGIYDMPSPACNSDIDLSLEDDEQTSLESSPSESARARSSDGADENSFPTASAVSDSTYAPTYGEPYAHPNVPSMDVTYGTHYTNLDMCQYQGAYSNMQMGGCSIASSPLDQDNNRPGLVNYNTGDELLSGVTTWFN